MPAKSSVKSKNADTAWKGTNMIRTTDPEYSFTLLLSGFEELTDEIANAFYEACDDCTLAISCGLPEASFTRSAPTLKDAIFSAIGDVRKVGPGIDVLRIDCDSLLTQAEIARKIGRSRQRVHQLILGGDFPPPVRARSSGMSGQPLWQWSAVAEWLCRHELAPDSLRRDAQAVETINCVLDYNWKSKHDGPLLREARTAIAGKRTA